MNWSRKASRSLSSVPKRETNPPSLPSGWKSSCTNSPSRVKLYMPEYSASGGAGCADAGAAVAAAFGAGFGGCFAAGLVCAAATAASTNINSSFMDVADWMRAMRVPAAQDNPIQNAKFKINAKARTTHPEAASAAEGPHEGSYCDAAGRPLGQGPSPRSLPDIIVAPTAPGSFDR